ncbi:helix-turn-helix domain-containing protein, partial [Escherichia coli]|nr:DNA-binding protein [Escherichia coli]
MSIDALRWAKKVKTGSSSSKSVLTWLADMCGADLCAYPSVSALAEVTELNKKTVQDSLRHLMEIGLIVDTGERKGRTKQIVVYRLIGVEESVAEPEYTQKRVS